MGGPKGVTDIKAKRLKADGNFEEYSVTEYRAAGKSSSRGLEFSKGDKVVALYVGAAKGSGDVHDKKFYAERANAILAEKEGEEPLKGWPKLVTIPQSEGIPKVQEIEWECFWPVDFEEEKNEKEMLKSARDAWNNSF